MSIASKHLCVLPSIIFLIQVLLHPIGAIAQNGDKDFEKAISGLQIREIGPALMGGRISDIEIHPSQPSTWYVSAGSGNLWKTVNRGTTWTPIFDNENSYSIGDIAIDPNNPSIIWLGTGENVSGRHVGWGDGIYKSLDAGTTWKNMGLKSSEHIGKILIDPRNSEIIYVACEGPLWSGGGERGLYKSIDGGITWKNILALSQYTGVTDIEFDPSNPDIIYAASYQRFRRAWALMAGGPESGIYKSADNGENWKRLSQGLPKNDMGKIGLAVTPANPNLVYATIEAGEEEKGFYRSTDKGESWEKRNSYISGGTGPHYYQEIEVSPEDPDLVYQMDVFLHVTRDGGKNFDYLTNGKTKHSDNHAFWIDPNDGLHLIAGTDGGLYESYDEGKSWKHFSNLPISQFYKLGLDNTEPYYNIVGGAQDLGTLIGPSRTTNVEGIRNGDWYVPLGADGYGSVYDWNDNNTVYMMWQEGNLYRHNVKTGENIAITPLPVDTEIPERWNWDSPIMVSPHKHQRIYYGSQRLWKSDNRGDSWEAISPDLTTNTNRYELALMDRVWSVDDLYDNRAMSKYSTLTCIAESPLQEGLLYTGSDDGLVQVSEDGGKNWRKSSLKIPARSFINDIEASNHDANTLFTVVDAHKIGDYKPYIFMSTDKGKTWKSISGDLETGNIVWVIKQDHETPDLLFIGTEKGMYFSQNKGLNWYKLKSGMPTIPIRDIAIQKRENDLVAASFGRGIFILDDYSSLRNVKTAIDNKETKLFPIRDAWWYVPTVPMQAKGMPGQGSGHYVAKNPPFGALFTYYLAEKELNKEEQRKKKEEDIKKASGNIPFPGWDNLNTEKRENEAQVLILIKEENDIPIRWLKAINEKGLHRVNWDLKLPAAEPIRLSKPAFQPPWQSDPEGPMVAPGTYYAEIYVENNGDFRQIGERQDFKVKAIPDLGQQDFQSVAAFQVKTKELIRELSSMAEVISEYDQRLNFIQETLKQTPKASDEQYKTYGSLKNKLFDLETELYGDHAKGSLEESRLPGILGRLWYVSYGHWESTQMPTETFKQNLEKAENDFESFKNELANFSENLIEFEKELKSLGAPYTKGRGF